MFDVSTPALILLGVVFGIWIYFELKEQDERGL